jgi:hypothetical protein
MKAYDDDVTPAPHLSMTSNVALDYTPLCYLKTHHFQLKIPHNTGNSRVGGSVEPTNHNL